MDHNRQIRRRQSRRRQELLLLEFALGYAKRGWSIIPIALGTKKTPKNFRWKQYQENRPNENLLRDWFAYRDDLGLAVILGEISGGLVCRDFDDKPSYQRWKRTQKYLADRLPTVETPHGYHVYFRTKQENLTFRDLRPVEEGEYRGDSGHYCLLPPSKHPDGHEYKWLVALPDELPFIDDVVAAGFLPSVDVTQKAQEATRKVQVVGGGRLPNKKTIQLTPTMKDFLEEVIMRSLPTGPGQRRKKLLDIARQLKFSPEFAGITTSEISILKPHLKLWWETAKPKTSGTHPYFSTTWQDFVFAWEEARVPFGETMIAVFEKARSTPPPRLAVEKYGKGSARALLASFCRELQKFGGGDSFYLSGRTAEPYFPVSSVQIWRWLKQLTDNHIIEVVKEYPRGIRLATEYRYLLDD